MGKGNGGTGFYLDEYAVALGTSPAIGDCSGDKPSSSWKKSEVRAYHKIKTQLGQMFCFPLDCRGLPRTARGISTNGGGLGL